MATIETHMSVSGMFDVRANICWQALDLHLNWTMETSSLVQFLKVSFILMSFMCPVNSSIFLTNCVQERHRMYNLAMINDCRAS